MRERYLAARKDEPVICQAPARRPREHPIYGMRRARRKLYPVWDGAALFKCGRRVPRKMRGQIYCSKACRRRAIG
jgi:hypothetical protein